MNCHKVESCTKYQKYQNNAAGEYEDERRIGKSTIMIIGVKN